MTVTYRNGVPWTNVVVTGKGGVKKQVPMIVDSGASQSSLPASAANGMTLKIKGIKRVTTAGGVINVLKAEAQKWEFQAEKKSGSGEETATCKKDFSLGGAPLLGNDQIGAEDCIVINDPKAQECRIKKR